MIVYEKDAWFLHWWLFLSGAVETVEAAINSVIAPGVSMLHYLQAEGFDSP
ncbi:hypothetical protein [Lacisediminimonas profundi]|uniref:hypothetical protein n=1 Tax=Lacisediminimonas profundi TaxID=2603856 RepID=UPI001F50224D|nr:hypothetical protein [Lacisediminimonas profundi]